jgi:aspartate-semialdehyde dehydrogenase
VSAIYAPKAGKAGCVVIDNTSQFRYDDDIPLVVPEVNEHAIAQYRNRNIIANPNCSTIQMLVALKPIYDAVGIERINVATYQAVSGTGKEAIEELATQTANLLNGRPVEAEGLPEADRVQRAAADRRLPGQRIYEGRNEDGLGDAQDHG